MSSVSLTVRESTVNVSDCMGGEGDIVGGDEVVNILLELVALVDVSVVDNENEEHSVVSCVVGVVDAVVSVIVVSTVDVDFGRNSICEFNRHQQSFNWNYIAK